MQSFGADASVIQTLNQLDGREHYEGAATHACANAKWYAGTRAAQSPASGSNIQYINKNIFEISSLRIGPPEIPGFGDEILSYM